MKTQFEQMMDGLNDVEAFLAGEQEGDSGLGGPGRFRNWEMRNLGPRRETAQSEHT